MAAQQRSLAITERYRARLLQIRTRVETAALLRFPAIDELDASHFPEQMAAVITTAQMEAVRASGGYLAAFVSSELGRRLPVHATDSRAYAGLARDGRPLTLAFQSPLVAVRAKLAEGVDPVDAIEAGRQRAKQMAETDLMHAARSALRDSMQREKLVSGWQRAVQGTCGACLGEADLGVRGDGESLDIHPNCQCIAEPVINTGAARALGVALTAKAIERFQRPSSRQRFEAMPPAEQVDTFGAETAKRLRAGELDFAELVDRSPQVLGDDYITQKPVQDL